MASHMGRASGERARGGTGVNVRSGGARNFMLPGLRNSTRRPKREEGGFDGRHAGPRFGGLVCGSATFEEGGDRAQLVSSIASRLRQSSIWPGRMVCGLPRMEAMAKHRTYSIEFKRQVAQEYIAGETLHALAKRHDLSRNLIRIWSRSTKLAPSRTTPARAKFGNCQHGHHSLAREKWP